MAGAMIRRLHLTRLDADVVLAGGVFRAGDPAFEARIGAGIDAVAPGAHGPAARRAAGARGRAARPRPAPPGRSSRADAGRAVRAAARRGRAPQARPGPDPARDRDERPSAARDGRPWRTVRSGRHPCGHEPARTPTPTTACGRRPARPDDRARPDHHARRLRGARDLDGHADRRRASSAASSSTAGSSRRSSSARSIGIVVVGGAHRPRRARPCRSPSASGCSRSACWSAAWRRRCRCSSSPGSSRASAPGRSRRSPTSPSAGRLPERAPAADVRDAVDGVGPARASSARRSPASVGETHRLALRLPRPAAAHRGRRRR